MSYSITIFSPDMERIWSYMQRGLFSGLWSMVSISRMRMGWGMADGSLFNGTSLGLDLSSDWTYDSDDYGIGLPLPILWLLGFHNPVASLSDGIVKLYHSATGNLWGGVNSELGILWVLVIVVIRPLQFTLSYC